MLHTVSEVVKIKVKSPMKAQVFVCSTFRSYLFESVNVKWTEVT